MLGGFMYYDSTYILVIIGLLLSMYASAKVNSTFNKYSKVRSRSGLTGAMAAERILRMSGINDVRIEQIAGELTDHYDPSKKVLRLSQSVYGNTSVAAIGVAAHECGHAIQHQKAYAPLVLRSTLVPVANICSKASIPVFVLGLFLGMNEFLVSIGILLFAVGLLFQIVTLPVEFNASHRAVRILEDNVLTEEELVGTKKVLSAAAMTYVAATVATLLQLLRLILISQRRRD